MRRVKVPVPLEECKRRAMGWIKSRPHGYMAKMSEFSAPIWPDTTFLNGQGAAAAASRIIGHLKRDGFIEWDRDASNWGWRLTEKGRIGKL